MNFLILHNMGPHWRWLASVADSALALPRYAPEHEYLVHNAYVPLPEFVKDIDFDAIIMNSTFIGLCHTREGMERLEREYGFLKGLSGVKIALPQDDYWCSEVRDSFFIEWKIDRVYPVCPQEHWNILYPRYMNSKGQMKLGYTSYITPKIRELSRSPMPREKRKFDVIYRAKEKPFFPNRLGILKGEIGEIFKKNFADENLTLDISTRPEDMIPGDKWFSFVESSRCILGSNSGSSLLVRNHEMAECIKKYVYDHPGAGIDEIEVSCFPGQDGKYIFTAISPRNIEAGLLKTVQLLTPGPYSNILSPWEHYVPLSLDCSNKSEVMSIIKDIGAQNEIVERCKKRLLSFQDIQIENFISEIIETVSSALSLDHCSLPRDIFSKQVNRYKEITSYTEHIADKHTRSRARISRMKKLVKDILPSPMIKALRKLQHHAK